MLEDKLPCAINGKPDVFSYVVGEIQYYCRREHLVCPYRDTGPKDDEFMTPARCMYYETKKQELGGISEKVP